MSFLDDDDEFDGDGRDDEAVGPSPPWLHLLSPQLREWRRTQILKGREPDAYIEGRLREDGSWPPGPATDERTGGDGAA